MTCMFCDEETYQLCKVEIVGFESENYVIGLCRKHFIDVAKTLPHIEMEKLQ